MLEVNLSGTLRVVREALPLLIESGGAIELVASVLGTQPMPGGTPYAVSKAGLLDLRLGTARAQCSNGCSNPAEIGGSEADSDGRFSYSNTP